MPKPTHTFEKIDQAIQQLWQEKDKKKSTYLAIDLANQILQMLGIPEDTLKESDLVLDEALPTSKFSNQKMETWYEPHFRFTSARLALNHFDDPKYLLKSRFYQLNESATKARISASTQIDDNWEDSELTRKPEYKVGIDFFLNADANALLMVVSNYGNLRVLELTEKISHTQIDIFNNLVGLMQKHDGIDPKTGERIEFEPQKSIHKSLWDSLALETVNKNFYEEIADLFNELQQFIIKNPPSTEIENLTETSKIFSIRILGRILFTWFLRKKEFINSQENYFDIVDLESTDYYESKLKPLFFETFNRPIEDRTSSDKTTPYLNGGLFSAHEDDLTQYSVQFPKAWFNRLYDHLYRYNFTIDESSPEYEQVAIDPEMLGRVFENLLASIVPETSKLASERRNKGAFYTPRQIVDFMCKEAIKEYLFKKVKNTINHNGIIDLVDMIDSRFLERKSTSVVDLWDKRSSEVKVQIIEAINEIKVFDPAVGSGAFPMGILNQILKITDRLSAVYDSVLDKLRVSKSGEKINSAEVKLFILRKILYGVDIEPMAIEITRLRAWLSLIIDAKLISAVEPLPNLDFNYVCANSIVPLKTNVQLNLFQNNTQEELIKKLRDDYFNAHNYKEKEFLKMQFNNAFYNRFDENDNDQIRQLKTWNPFGFKAADFFDAKKMLNQEKFDVVIGNPPYIGEKGNKNLFDLVKETDFGKLYYRGKMDYFYFFFHLGINLLKKDGILSYITTNYYPTADGAKLLRKHMYQETTILKLINFNEIKIFDSAKGQHDLITVLQKGLSDKQTEQITAKINELKSVEINRILKGDLNYSTIQYQNRENLFTNISTNDFYIRFASESLTKEEVLQKIKNNSSFFLGEKFNVNQGIITGADKFSKKLKNRYSNINEDENQGIFVHNKNFLSSIGIESNLIKPFFKNSDISRWKPSKSSSSEIIYLDGSLVPANKILDYLSKFKEVLISREEFVEGKRKWYEIHRSRNEHIFKGPKIIVPQRNILNIFAYSENDWYASADVYFISNKDSSIDLMYLLGLLNSRLMYLWLYYRGKRKGEYLELYRTPILEIPIFKPTQLITQAIVELVKKIIFDDSLNAEKIYEFENKINILVYSIYDLSDDEINLIDSFYLSKLKIK